MPQEVRENIVIDVEGIKKLAALQQALSNAKAALNGLSNTPANIKLTSQKAVDTLMRDFTRPDTNKQILAGLGGPSVSKGGGMSSALGMGAAAGVTAAITLQLIKTLKDMVSQSKIANSFMDGISKALGLMLDLVLLPFLPILTYALLALYAGVITLGNLWKTFFGSGKSSSNGSTPDKGPTLGNALGIDTSTLGTDLISGLEKAILNLPLTSLFSGAAGAIIGAIAAALLVIAVGGAVLSFSGVAAVIIGALVGALIGSKLIDIAAQSGNDFMAELRKKYGDTGAYSVIATGGIGALVGAIFGGLIGSFAGPVGTALGATLGAIIGGVIVTGLIMWAYGAGQIVGTALSPILKPALTAVANLFIWVVNGISSALRLIPGLGSIIPGNIPYLDVGGTIAETGVAVVHKGETVTPAGKSSGGNIYNFYGYDDKSLQTKVKSILRQEGTRYAQ